MGFYERHLLPRLIDWSCGSEAVTRQRRRLVPRARGRVLEIGVGSGRNLPFYEPARVTRLLGLEPALEMRRLAEPVARGAGLEVEWLEGSGEGIPLADASVDTVVMTYTLCSIPEPVAAAREIARVLGPEGRLLFCEHGASPERSVRRWQDRLTPLWSRWTGGCHLNREISTLLERGGLRVVELETMYNPGWKPSSFNYRGRAVPARGAS